MHRFSLPALVLAFGLPVAAAAQCPLDPGFGAGGVVRTDLGVSANLVGIALLPDGRIVAAGNAGGIALARYLPDGSLDPSFGTGGLVTGVAGSATDVGVQSDGGIVVVGSSVLSGASEMTVFRFDSTGALDPAFGTGGISVTPPPGSFNGSNLVAVAIQADDRIVAVGSCCNSPFQNPDQWMVRYDTTGTPDVTFNGGGFRGIGSSGTRGLYDVIVQADGKLVTVGWGGGLTSGSAYAWRVNPDGSTDCGFNCVSPCTCGGSLSENFGSPGFVRFWTVGQQPDGKLVMTASADSVGYGAARTTTAGLLDPSFGTGGLVTGVSATGYEIAIQPDGKHVVGGGANYRLTRFLADGSLDTGFGSGGSVTAPVAGSTAGLALQGDGKLIAAGTNGGDFELVRYLPAGSGGASLTGSQDTLSLTAGGGPTWTLCTAPQYAGDTYIVAGTTAGTVPGLVVNGVPVPLNDDGPGGYMAFTLVAANSPLLPGSLGTLDSQGLGTAALQVPPGSVPSLAGTTLHHAFVVLSLAGGTPTAVFASNAAPLSLLP